MTTLTMERTDQEIQKDVLEELKWDPRVKPNEIGVSVSNGVATLTGFVDSYLKKWAAEEAAHTVKGVRAVANDIEVKLPGSAERTDPEIADAVSRAIEWDTFIPADRVEVTVSKGWVTLDGELEYQYQKEDAERAARRVTGVRGLTNLIRVKPGKPSPSDLKKKIEDALVRSAETDADRISVEVRGSTVVLKGTVRSYAEKQEAARVAWSAPGVTSVENQISVVP
jgi:osmotically-inducible protein OsmY